jgi:exosortase family protein XrtF
MADRTTWTRIATFVGKAIAIYGLWYVAYDLWLQPSGVLDRQVSLSVASLAGHLASIAGTEVVVEGRELRLARSVGVRIVDGCNGLTTIGLFIGFVVAFPGSALRRAVFLPLGIAVIYASNVLRVAMLVLFREHWPPGFNFVHDLGAPAFFYLIVMGLWIVWANYGAASPRHQTPDSSSVGVHA